MSEREPRIEAMREEFFKEKARETIYACDMISLLEEPSMIEAHMDTIAGYLNTMVFPDVEEQFAQQYGIPVEARERVDFLRTFESVLLEEATQLQGRDLSEEEAHAVKIFIEGIRDFVVETSITIE